MAERRKMFRTVLITLRADRSDDGPPPAPGADVEDMLGAEVLQKYSKDTSDVRLVVGQINCECGGGGHAIRRQTF